MSNSASDTPVREYENVGAGLTAGAYVGSALDEALQSNPDWNVVGSAPVAAAELPDEDPALEAEVPEIPETPDEDPENPSESADEQNGEPEDEDEDEVPDLDHLERSQLDELAAQLGVEKAEELDSDEAVKEAIQAALSADEQNGEG